MKYAIKVKVCPCSKSWLLFVLSQLRRSVLQAATCVRQPARPRLTREHLPLNISSWPLLTRAVRDGSFNKPWQVCASATICSPSSCPRQLWLYTAIPYKRRCHFPFLHEDSRFVNGWIKEFLNLNSSQLFLLAMDQALLFKTQYFFHNPHQIATVYF